MINSLSEIWFDERKSIKSFLCLFLLPYSFAFPSTIWFLRLLFTKFPLLANKFLDSEWVSERESGKIFSFPNETRLALAKMCATIKLHVVYDELNFARVIILKVVGGFFEWQQQQKILLIKCTLINVQKRVSTSSCNDIVARSFACSNKQNSRDCFQIKMRAPDVAMKNKTKVSRECRPFVVRSKSLSLLNFAFISNINNIS